MPLGFKWQKPKQLNASLASPSARWETLKFLSARSRIYGMIANPWTNQSYSAGSLFWRVTKLARARFSFLTSRTAIGPKTIRGRALRHPARCYELETKIEVEDNCGSCSFYDVSTQRKFDRKVGKVVKGVRSTITEIRACCRNPKSKANGHLVDSKSTCHANICYVKGEYIVEKKEKPAVKKPKKNPDTL